MAKWRFNGHARTARRYSRLDALSAVDPRRLAVVYPALPANLLLPGVAGAAIRDGPQPGQSMDSPPARGAAGHSGLLPSCGHEGMEQRLERPQDLLEQLRGDRGQNTGHTVKHVWLIKAMLTILFLSGTSAGRTHDKRIAEAAPSPVPVGCRWLQDLDCLAFTRNQVEILMPTKPPGPGPDAGTESHLSAHGAPPRLHRARQQLCHTLPASSMASVAAGRLASTSWFGNWRCMASRSGASHTLAPDG